MFGRKIQPSTATSTTVDAKLHKTNVQNTKQKPEKTSGHSKNDIEPDINRQQKIPAEDTYLQTYQLANEIRFYKKI